MTRYGMFILSFSLGIALISCKPLNESPTSASGSMSASSQQMEAQRRPLKLRANKKFIKHRPVNRRAIHRIHRIRRAVRAN